MGRGRGGALLALALLTACAATAAAAAAGPPDSSTSAATAERAHALASPVAVSYDSTEALQITRGYVGYVALPVLMLTGRPAILHEYTVAEVAEAAASAQAYLDSMREPWQERTELAVLTLGRRAGPIHPQLAQPFVIHMADPGRLPDPFTVGDGAYALQVHEQPPALYERQRRVLGTIHALTWRQVTEPTRT